jgi:hypothetical protein
MPSASLHVAVIDIGKTENIGWAIDDTNSGKEIDGFVDALAGVLNEGPLALGFEAPMFAPLHHNSVHLTRARHGEGNRPFTAGAGANALVCGLVVVPYILSKLWERVQPAAATFDWTRLPTARRHVLVFEAFVTRQPAPAIGENCHIRDAKVAIEKFREGMRGGFNNAICEPNSLNLLGAALLRTEWTKDLSVLSQPCLVVMGRGTQHA